MRVPAWLFPAFLCCLGVPAVVYLLMPLDAAPAAPVKSAPSKDYICRVAYPNGAGSPIRYIYDQKTAAVFADHADYRTLVLLPNDLAERVIAAHFTP